MDVEQDEMQFLGLVGILKQSFKLISTWRKIFLQISLALILPLSFIFLAQIEITHIMVYNLMSNEFRLLDTQIGSNGYKKLSDLVTTEFVELIIFKFAYFTFLLILSLLSTSAVVYTVASAYTSREITFKRVMSVVPMVWKRLMITFLYMFIALFVYNFFFVLVMVLCEFLIEDPSVGEMIILGLILLLVYLLGLVYATIIWQLACVVSVLEESYGLQAVIKSKNLLKGKLLVAGFIFLVLMILVWVLQLKFQVVVVYNRNELGMVQRVGFGALALVLLLGLTLFWMVVKTVIYFVCKSYHHENIDKSSLSNHLDVFLGDYVPLKTKDVQLEHFYV